MVHPFVVFRKTRKHTYFLSVDKTPETSDTLRMPSATYWIEKLQLTPHPEGGYYRQTYRSSEAIPHPALPERYAGARSYSTAIYFLLADTDVSMLHRIQSDEGWHFYAGTALTIHVFTPEGTYKPIHLGPDSEAGQVFQAYVPAGCWFGASVDAPNSYALVGCTVAPGFDFADFEMGKRSDLLTIYSNHAELIEWLTPPH